VLVASVSFPYAGALVTSTIYGRSFIILLIISIIVKVGLILQDLFSEWHYYDVSSIQPK
jgi:hypothetical protein